MEIKSIERVAEDDEPSVVIESIHAGFKWLIDNGYKDFAKSTLDESWLMVLGSEYGCGRKSSYRAKKDGDWQAFMNELVAHTKLDEFEIWWHYKRGQLFCWPASWRIPVQEAIEAKRRQLTEGTEDNAKG